MPANRVSLLLFVLVLLIGACGDQSPTKAPAASLSPASAYFANTVGTSWKYVAYDSVRDASDTIVVSIVDSFPVDSPEVATVWQYSNQLSWFGGKFTEMIIIVSPAEAKSGAKDSVFFCLEQPGHEPWRKELLLYPFEGGDVWAFDGGGLLPESTFVSDTTTVQTPAGTYNGVYAILTDYNCGDECGARRTIWFKPGVGIVRFNRLEWDHFDFPNAPQINATWDLVEATIAP